MPAGRIVALAVALFCLSLTGAEARQPWVTLQDCHYLIKRANDGDSFHVSVSGKEYIFRLYFVDTPETDTEFRDRVEEQAKYFGITVEQTVQVGEVAKAFTRERLSHPFIVRTCFADAMGRSRLPRFYAFVQTNTGDLGEQLIENGLARIHGKSAKPVVLLTAASERAKLKQLEEKARLEKVGGWGVNQGRMTARATQAESTKGVDPFDAFFHPEKGAPDRPAAPPRAAGSPEPKVSRSVRPSSPLPSRPAPSRTVADTNALNQLDVNTASATELENVPGIGPVLAQRIVAARPFQSADDLKGVKGVGTGKKYEQIRPFFK